MANWDALGSNVPKFMSGDGRAHWWSDKAVVTTALAAGDVIRFKLPAGVTLHFLEVRPDDLDSSTGITFTTGYAPVSADDGPLVAAPTYFATAKTNMQNGTAMQPAFAPIKFNQDVWITLTIAVVATTPVAGNVWVVAGGNCAGANI